ncbi:MAG TPA: hypothetical protein VNA20_07550 [Frankiaceae bacterium]|nr:hypothetical protein [Frankiaceae bacterium]
MTRAAIRAAGVALTAALLAGAPAAPADAAVSLTTKLLTWGVIGLDSNNVNTGPALFPVGARVCNTGSTAATGLTARFVWDSSNPYLNVSGPASLPLPTLAAGACRDAYFNVAVTRTSAAYLTARRFHITFSGGGATRSTPVRELYVEKLISQNRNEVLGISGPATMVLGESYAITVSSETAPGGYEQVETFLTLPTSIFRIDSVTSTASAGASPVSQPYLDACNWEDDPTDPDYRDCLGTGKAGGAMTTTYRVTVVGLGSGTSTTLVYDFSGSSYHYNTDYGDAPNLYTWQTVAPDLTVTKAHAPAEFADGGTGTFTLTVRNEGAAATTEPITLVDTLPAGLTYVSASGGRFTCSAAGRVVTCVRSAALAPGAAAVVTVTVRADVAATTTVTNVVTVATPNDPDLTDNRDTDTVRVVVPPATTPGTPTTDPGTAPGTADPDTTAPGTPGSGDSGALPRTPGGAAPGTAAGPGAPGAPNIPGAPGGPAQPLPTGPLAKTGAESGSALRLAFWLVVAGVLLVELGVPGPRLVPELARRRATRRRTR